MRPEHRGLRPWGRHPHDDGWARPFATVSDFDHLHRLITATVRTLVSADGATFVARDDDRCFYVAEDAIAPLWAGQRFPITECISGWCLLHDEPAVVPDIYVDARIPQEAYRPTFVKTLVMVPVRGGGPAGTARGRVPVAAIGAYWSTAGVPSGRQVTALQRLATVTSGALAELGVENAPWAPQLRSRTEDSREQGA